MNFPGRLRLTRAIKLLIAMLLAGYWGAGIYLHYSSIDEVFPVYSWSLFSHVPHQYTRFTLLLLEIDGKRISPPIVFEHAENLIENPHSIEAQRVIQWMGRYILGRLETKVDRYRKVLEKDYLPPRTTYAVVLHQQRPIEFFTKGEQRLRHLRTYHAQEDVP